MMEDPKPARQADATVAGSDDEGVMIDVKGFYSDHLEEGHRNTPSGM